MRRRSSCQYTVPAAQQKLAFGDLTLVRARSHLKRAVPRSGRARVLHRSTAKHPTKTLWKVSLSAQRGKLARILHAEILHIRGAEKSKEPEPQRVHNSFCKDMGVSVCECEAVLACAHACVRMLLFLLVRVLVLGPVPLPSPRSLWQKFRAAKQSQREPAQAREPPERGRALQLEEMGAVAAPARHLS